MLRRRVSVNSLYLIHAPIVAAIDLWLQSIQISPSLRLLAAMAISVPLSMGLAYLFYLVFEKRFISNRK